MSMKMELSWMLQSVLKNGTQLRPKNEEGISDWRQRNKLAGWRYGDLIKDLKVKGAPKDLKQRNARENIRIVEGDHKIDCKIDGLAQWNSQIRICEEDLKNSTQINRSCLSL